MNRPRVISTIVVSLAMFAFVIGSALAAPKKGKQNHHSGHDKLGAKLKTNGTHQLDKHGKHTVSADVKDGKVAAFHVKHDTKGDVAVKKYKSKTKVASLEGSPSQPVPVGEVIGTAWIGFSYIDDDGYEEIWWFPYDEVYDPDTGAIDYVPAS